MLKIIILKLEINFYLCFTICLEIIIKYLAQGGTGHIYFLSLWLSYAFSRTSLFGLSPPLHNSFPFQLDYWHTLVSPALKILLWVLIQIVFLIKACPNLSCSQILVDPQSLEQCLAYISHSVTIYRMNLSILLHRHTSQNGSLYFSLLLLPLTFLYSLAHSNGASVLKTQQKHFLSVWQVNSMLSNPVAALLISNSWFNQDVGWFITISFLKCFPSQLCDSTVTKDLQVCPYPVSLASSSQTSFMTFFLYILELLRTWLWPSSLSTCPP